MFAIFRLFSLLLTVALAQEKTTKVDGVDVEDYKKALSIVQVQRNQAMDAAASLELRAAKLAEENEKLKKQLEEAKHAEQKPEDGPHDGGRGPRPEVRSEGGRPDGSGQRVQPSR